MTAETARGFSAKARQNDLALMLTLFYELRMGDDCTPWPRDQGYDAA